MRAVLTPRAQKDLDEIWDYTLSRWGLDQAERYVRGIGDAIRSVAEDPRRGRPCNEIRPGYRKYSIGSHVLFYRARPTGVEIVRILHQRMDYDQHL